MSALKFPFQLDMYGRVAIDLTRENMDRSVVLLTLGTSIGERVMRPQYGTSATDALAMSSQVVYEDDTASNSVQDVVREAMIDAFDRLLPDLVLQDVKFTADFGGASYMADVYWSYSNTDIDPTRVENGQVDVQNLVGRIGAF